MEQKKLQTFPVLKTDRLTLRQLSKSDVDEILLLRSDTLINKYLGRQPTVTLKGALEFIEQIINNSFSYWAIEQNVDKKMVGTICLFDISEKLKKCEIGYELLTEYQGNGIMEEAAKRVIQYSVKILGLRNINAYTHKDNQSSINLLKKLKFKNTHKVVDPENSNLSYFSFITETNE
jgi:ribosomal-protein-alanine N-acetyltransferase